MGTWHVPADVLATSGFTISPKADVVGALGALTVPRTPEQRAFQAAHGAAFAAWLADQPVAGDLVRSSFRPRVGERPGWLADYLCLPPAVPDPGFEQEIALVAGLGDDDMRSDLLETTGRPLAPALLEPGLRDTAVALLRWLWTHTLETDWPRRERLLRADIVSRTAQLASATRVGRGAARPWSAPPVGGRWPPANQPLRSPRPRVGVQLGAQVRAE